MCIRKTYFCGDGKRTVDQGEQDTYFGGKHACAFIPNPCHHEEVPMCRQIMIMYHGVPFPEWKKTILADDLGLPASSSFKNLVTRTGFRLQEGETPPRWWNLTRLEALADWTRPRCVLGEGVGFHRGASLASHDVVHLLSHVWLFVTPRTEAHQASLSFTDSLHHKNITCNT